MLAHLQRRLLRPPLPLRRAFTLPSTSSSLQRFAPVRTQLPQQQRRSVVYIRFGGSRGPQKQPPPPEEPNGNGHGPNGRRRPGGETKPISPFFIASTGIVAAGAVYYYVTNLEQVPETGRWRFNNISPETEAELGEQTRLDIRREFGRGILPPDHALSKHVRRIVARILEANNLGVLRDEHEASDSAQRKRLPVPWLFGLVLGRGNEQAQTQAQAQAQLNSNSSGSEDNWDPDANFGGSRSGKGGSGGGGGTSGGFDTYGGYGGGAEKTGMTSVYGPQKLWDVVVVNDPKTVNAMASPGIIVVFTGILPVCEDEEGLAAVISHEIGHVVARHTAERISSQILAYGLIFLIKGLIPADLGLTSLLHTYLLELPNNRTQETEADLIGLRLMSRACYDPAASPKMFARLGQLEAQHGSGGGWDFFHTHPSSPKRVKILEERLHEGYSIMSENSQCDQFRQQLEQFRATARHVSVDPQDGHLIMR